MEYWCAALHAEGLRPMKRWNDECNEGRTEEQKRGYYHMVIGQDSLFEIPKNKNRIPEFSCWQFFCSKLEARRPTNEWWCQERRSKLTRFRILDIVSLTVRSRSFHMKFLTLIRLVTFVFRLLLSSASVVPQKQSPSLALSSWKSLLSNQTETWSLRLLEATRILVARIAVVSNV